MKNSTLFNSILVFIAGISYGFIVPTVKIANAQGILPSQFLAAQYGIAFAACLVFMLARRVPWGTPKDTLPLLVLGVFTGLTSICFYSAISLLPSSASLTLLFQYVWISVLIECIHKRKLPHLSTVIAIVIVLAGTVMATGVLDGSVHDLNPLGVLYGLGSALFYALFLYFSGIIGVGKPTALRATMLAAGGLVATSICQPFAFAIMLAAPSGIAYSCLLAVLGILFPTTLINFASPKLSAGMVSVMASTELPAGILAAWAIVGDVPSPLVLTGALLVLVGVLAKQIPDVIAQRNSEVNLSR